MQVYDYRTDNRNVLVTPEIRARLYHMKPGQVDGRHSHDLGVEVFLILEGKAEFTIQGHTEVLGPGQMCIAMADEVHQVRNLLPDQRTVMYLSVTPHILPTHTGRTESDDRLPHRFQRYEPATGEDRSVATLLDTHMQRFIRCFPGNPVHILCEEFMVIHIVSRPNIDGVAAEIYSANIVGLMGRYTESSALTNGVVNNAGMRAEHTATAITYRSWRE